MTIQAAEKLLADPGATVDSLLEVITWLTRDISNLRARKKCAQSQEMIDQIAEEISGNESALDKVKQEIVRRCS
jgi:type VI protein secretion system component VasF